MRRMTTMAVIVTCAVLSLAGCDSSTDDTRATSAQNPAAHAASLVDPCALLTKAEAETLLGEPVKPAEVSENPAVGAKLCMYNPVDEASMRFLQISLTQDAAMPGNGNTAASIFHSLKSNFEGSRTDFNDLGDEAFIATGGLHMLKGAYYVNIGAGNTSSGDIRSTLLEAGRKAVEKL